MQAPDTVSNGHSTRSGQHRHRDAIYQRVYDARKRRMRGLWVRNGRFYAQLTLEDLNTGKKQVRRIPLEGASTVPQAVEKLNDIKKGRRENSLTVLRRAPLFADYADEYFRYYAQVKDAKRESTLKTEGVAIRRWKEHLGHVRLHQITKAMFNGFIAKRQVAGVSGRTVNLEVIAFRNVLKRAIDEGWLRSLPTENLHPLKWTPRKRQLLALDQIEALCTTALNVSKNGREFADYVWLMAFSGVRKSEALRLKWSDVDWDQRQVTVGSGGMTKNRQSRIVDFNPKLEAHLKDMQARKAPDTQWLFPSPQRGNRDLPAKSFVESLRLARKEAKMPGVGFHDLRHFFISFCVMSGIDYMTIARWVGHQDGGILIGKVYGHLSNEHAKRQAQCVVFGPEVLEKATGTK